MFFTHVHGSLKSCLSSISLSLQNRLTSISASRRGDWDECVPILTTPPSTLQGRAVCWIVKWGSWSCPKGGLNSFGVALWSPPFGWNTKCTFDCAPALSYSAFYASPLVRACVEKAQTTKGSICNHFKHGISAAIMQGSHGTVSNGQKDDNNVHANSLAESPT